MHSLSSSLCFHSVAAKMIFWSYAVLLSRFGHNFATDEDLSYFVVLEFFHLTVDHRFAVTLPSLEGLLICFVLEIELHAV